MYQYLKTDQSSITSKNLNNNEFLTSLKLLFVITNKSIKMSQLNDYMCAVCVGVSMHVCMYEIYI